MSNALINIEWYNLKPKERNKLLPVLMYLQRTPSLKSGGVKPVTFEWFMKLLKSAYSSGLIILSLID